MSAKNAHTNGPMKAAQRLYKTFFILFSFSFSSEMKSRLCFYFAPPVGVH